MSTMFLMFDIRESWANLEGARSSDLFRGVTYWNQFSEASIQTKSYHIYLPTTLLKHKNEKT